MPYPRFVPALIFGYSIAAGAAAAEEGFYNNPVRAGDFPDPSVIRVGPDYWATATSSEWSPHFPLLHSRDLVNWEVTGHVFPDPPAWAKGNFWAPEISVNGGKYFVYYTARRSDNNRLAIAVAMADRPGGPYTDHGPLIAQEAGSIDAMPFTDARGVRWLVWKEDGNSRKLPTPIWRQRLSDDGLALVGERKEILRNDAPWEGAVTEGPFVLRRGDYYYLFYSGNACCGRDCNYALGVARAKEFEGPWEKAPSNPILAGNSAWRCPGHGSIVTDPDGRFWFLYHSYAQKGFVATGREMMLDEVVFGADAWPVLNRGDGPSTRASSPRGSAPQKDVTVLHDDFSGATLGAAWQWPIGRRPRAHLAGGKLILETTADGPAIAVQSTTVPSYVAETAVERSTLTQGASAGLAIFGDRVNHLTVLTDGKVVQVWSERRSERLKVAEAPAAAGPRIRLRVACVDGNRFRFAAQDEGGRWRELAGETDGSFLPPWDRGVRVGVTAAGPAGAAASFDYFTATPGDETLFQL